MTSASPTTKLIEVSLPLDVINRESAREKSIRHGHPSTLHLWWARRPLAAARAVLFAQLVDDPSAHPDRFPTEEAQRAERARLHGIIERLVPWEATRDEGVLDEARAEILASTGGNPPPILDPFAGGGTIPLEAQRLGLETHASDLNPVAVLINKALVEIPPIFAGRAPVHPALQAELVGWQRAQGLAADVRAYGEWMRDEAHRRIGHLYPQADLPNGSKAPVIAWIWARTVTCPNPACGIEMPLVRSWSLGKKKGKEAFVVPSVVGDPAHPSGLRVAYDIGHEPSSAPTAETDGTVGRTGATCLACHTAVPLKYVRAEGQARRMSQRLMAVVAEGKQARTYLPPGDSHETLANVPSPDRVPTATIPPKAPSFRVQAYGMTRWADLFTPRQLMALSTLSDLVMEARERVLADALAAGQPEGDRLEAGGSGAAAYADAVATYLGLAIGRATNKNSSINSWDSSPKMEAVRGLFARQAVPMAWDFAEANIFGGSSGDYHEDLQWVCRALAVSPANGAAIAAQGNAAELRGGSLLISTDPPYYDNIGYSDLSDFFYVWHRRALQRVFPALLSTMLVPKSEELVANPYRHDGKAGAKQFFEDGFRQVFRRARESALPDYPITVYYAFKQSETADAGESSSGWQTLLDGMISGGWTITATWPLRSELSNRMIASGTNALASSIVLALRPRPEGAPTTDRRGFIGALQAELPDALRTLQQGAIAPVDLPQAAIGPGMAVFSRYSAVLEPDGSSMTVRSALERINEILDQVLAEQETDFDTTTRFALAWYRQHAYDRGSYGEAEGLVLRFNTAVASLERHRVLRARGGHVELLRPSDLDEDYDVSADAKVSAWEVLHHLVRVLGTGGISAAGALLAQARSRTQGDIDADLVKELAHLLFRVAEQRGHVKDAIAFNALVTSWPDVLDAARAEQDAKTRPASPAQGNFTFEEEE